MEMEFKRVSEGPQHIELNPHLKDTKSQEAFKKDTKLKRINSEMLKIKSGRMGFSDPVKSNRFNFF